MVSSQQAASSSSTWPPLLASLRSARTRSSRTFMPRTRPWSPEGHVMTSAMRCLHGGKAAGRRTRGTGTTNCVVCVADAGPGRYEQVLPILEPALSAKDIERKVRSAWSIRAGCPHCVARFWSTSHLPRKDLDAKHGLRPIRGDALNSVTRSCTPAARSPEARHEASAASFCSGWCPGGSVDRFDRAGSGLAVGAKVASVLWATTGPSALGLRLARVLPQLVSGVVAAHCTSSKKSYVSVTDSMMFSSLSLSHSPATNFTGQARESDQRRRVRPSRSCCTMSRLRL
jgi:hypothetical protein